MIDHTSYSDDSRLKLTAKLLNYCAEWSVDWATEYFMGPRFWCCTLSSSSYSFRPLVGKFMHAARSGSLNIQHVLENDDDDDGIKSNSEALRYRICRTINARRETTCIAKEVRTRASPPWGDQPSNRLRTTDRLSAK